MANGAARLRIVNGILTTLGQASTSTLSTVHPDVQQAMTILDQQDFEFQSIGWSFNTDTAIALVPAFDGSVAVPETALKFAITACLLQYMTAAEKARYTRRGNLVYDTIAHTKTIGQTIRADIVTRIDVEDLPAVAQTYVGALCNEFANLGDDGDLGKQAKLEERTQRAWGFLHAAELKVLAVNALNSPQAQKLQYRSGTSGLGVNPLYPGG